LGLLATARLRTGSLPSLPDFFKGDLSDFISAFQGNGGRFHSL
jgi:hypothetical protein